MAPKKTVVNGPIASFTGRPYKVPERDLSTGDVLWESEDERKPRLVPADVRGIIILLIHAIPADKLTRQDSINATRIWPSLDEAPELEIEEDLWDWVLKKLESDQVGVKIFGMSAYAIERQVRDCEKKPEKPEEQERKS